MNKSYRHAVIAGNWKMNMLPNDIKLFAARLEELLGTYSRTDIIICTPSSMLCCAHMLLRTLKVKIGAQDVSMFESGAYTGENSAAQLKSLNAQYTIVGHSERRQYHNETDADVNAKVKILLEHDLTPIICVGERLEQRESGVTNDLIRYQVKSALAGLTDMEVKRCIIAYEPIWAIGTGKTATPEQAGEVCSAIRGVLKERTNSFVGRSVSILYGGSMNENNASELLAQPDIDGGLIGGASLSADKFVKIIEAAQ